jgi:hypothetical protein
MPLLWLLLGAAIAATPTAPYRGAATFALGVRGTTLSFVEHADGALAVRASDGTGATACPLPGRDSVVALRALLAEINDGWYRSEHVDFPVVPASGVVGSTPTCEFHAYTVGYRVYLQVSRRDGGAWTDLVTAELSPVRTSYTVTDHQTVQRVEDNADSVRVAAAALAAGAAASARGQPTLAAMASLYALGTLGAEVEDTATRYVHVIDAHTDLALSVIVLDTYLFGGHLPRADDIEAGYRIREILHEPSPLLFCRVLGRLASGRSAASILTSLQACGTERSAVECLE